MHKIIYFLREYLWIFLLSLPTRGAWIEIGAVLIGTLAGMSLPTRGAWIEIEYVFQPSSYG